MPRPVIEIPEWATQNLNCGYCGMSAGDRCIVRNGEWAGKLSPSPHADRLDRAYAVWHDGCATGGQLILGRLNSLAEVAEGQVKGGRRGGRTIAADLRWAHERLEADWRKEGW